MPTAEELNKAGMEAYKAGDLAGAVRAYEQAVELKPDYAPCLVNMCVALLKMGKPDTALQAALKAAQLAPKAGMCRYHLGHAYKAKNRWNEAVTEYVHAFELDNAHVAGMHFAAELCMDHGHSSKAIAYWGIFLKKAPPDHPRRKEAEEALAHAQSPGKGLISRY
jgi:tetratricopeptide (TPR) repeat protein